MTKFLFFAAAVGWAVVLYDHWSTTEPFFIWVRDKLLKKKAP
jgi:hypothetical protein